MNGVDELGVDVLATDAECVEVFLVTAEVYRKRGFSEAFCRLAGVADAFRVRHGLIRDRLDFAVDWCCQFDGRLNAEEVEAFLLEHARVTGACSGGVCH